MRHKFLMLSGITSILENGDYALDHVRFFPSEIEHVPSGAGSQLRTKAKISYD